MLYWATLLLSIDYSMLLCCATIELSRSYVILYEQDLLKLLSCRTMLLSDYTKLFYLLIKQSNAMNSAVAIYMLGYAMVLGTPLV